LKAGESALSFNPSSFMMAKNRIVKQVFLLPFLKALEFKMLPVVYGDVSFDKTLGCCILSTEVILEKLARSLASDYQVACTSAIP
ncbi:hypothetical protein ACFLZP_00280, partial [Patescibacteria group bacterium]